MDAITLLKADHRTVEKLFKAFEKAGESANVTKAKTVDQVISELSVHAAIEEQVFYPAARNEVGDTTGMVLESLEEHHVVKWLLSELEGMDPTDERYVAKMTVLMELVRHHVKEEEEDLFPQLRAAIGRKRMGEIGAALEEAKKVAPTLPHPRSPDTPPGNLVAGTVAGVVDKARKAGKKAAAKIQ